MIQPETFSDDIAPSRFSDWLLLGFEFRAPVPLTQISVKLHLQSRTFFHRKLFDR